MGGTCPHHSMRVHSKVGITSRLSRLGSIKIQMLQNKSTITVLHMLLAIALVQTGIGHLSSRRRIILDVS
jgi:hypothetical protein